MPIAAGLLPFRESNVIVVSLGDGVAKPKHNFVKNAMSAFAIEVERDELVSTLLLHYDVTQYILWEVSQ